MKRFIYLLLSISLIACGDNDDDTSTPTGDPNAPTDSEVHMCVSVEDRSCQLEFALVCPRGFQDACLLRGAGEDDMHECVPIEGGSCDEAPIIECHDKFVDGCTTGQTDVHMCVPKEGRACTSNQRWTCPSHFEDQCDL